MTTYILHGGKTSIINEHNDKFFEQFTKLVSKNEVTILLCYFSRERDKWDALIERDTNSIKKNTDKKVLILVAENPKDLLEKMDQADVLYVAGGEAELIEPTYNELSELGKKLAGKIYAGSSMGAFFPSEQYLLSFDSQDSKTIHKGIGLLPIQVLCHWDVEKEKEYKLNLLSKESDKPILTLNEFEFVVLYK